MHVYRNLSLSSSLKITPVRNQNKQQQPAMFEGLVILVAGVLLLTPGFFTDVFGFLLLIPSFRYWVFRQIEKRFIHIRSFNKETPNQHETIYDADYTDITPNAGSPWNKNKNKKD